MDYGFRSAFGVPGRLVILSLFLGLYRCFCASSVEM
jgi:hypothetical protein